MDHVWFVERRHPDGVWRFCSGGVSSTRECARELRDELKYRYPDMPYRVKKYKREDE